MSSNSTADNLCALDDTLCSKDTTATLHLSPSHHHHLLHLLPSYISSSTRLLSCLSSSFSFTSLHILPFLITCPYFSIWQLMLDLPGQQLWAKWMGKYWLKLIPHLYIICHTFCYFCLYFDSLCCSSIVSILHFPPTLSFGPLLFHYLRIPSLLCYLFLSLPLLLPASFVYLYFYTSTLSCHPGSFPNLIH